MIVPNRETSYEVYLIQGAEVKLFLWTAEMFVSDIVSSSEKTS